MIIRLSNVYGCSHNTIADLSSCTRVWMGHKDENTYYLAHRENLAIPIEDLGLWSTELLIR